MSDMSIERCQEIISTLEPLADNAPCVLINEKIFIGVSSSAGNLCRLRAWAEYLLAVLLCEFNLSPECCSEAEEEYCTSWEACPN